jgi:hypothetical protein
MNPTDKRTHWRFPIDRTNGDDDSEELVVSVRAMPATCEVQFEVTGRCGRLSRDEAERLIDDLQAALKEAQER